MSEPTQSESAHAESVPSEALPDSSSEPYPGSAADKVEPVSARRFFSADTLDRAIIAAAGHYHVAPAALAYQQVEKQHGFTKRRKVVIRVDPQKLEVDREAEPASSPPARSEPAPQREEARSPSASSGARPGQKDAAASSPAAPPSASPPERERPNPAPTAPETRAQAGAAPRAGSVAGGALVELPASPQSLRTVRRRADAATTKVAQRQLGLVLDLAGLNLEAEIFEGEEELEIELYGDDADLAVEDEGQVLRAIEHLMPRLMQADLGRVLPCRVDCENFQLLREESLRVKAQRAAESVRRRGQGQILEPMHPADRRIVHLALVADDSVTTESVGRGYFRRVSIRPA